MNWQAKWIWNQSESNSPRNQWWCFRKSFDCNQKFETSSGMKLHITADSRYVLFVNGEKVGFGPVRSWPFKQSYDTYEIGHRLKPGKNTVAVLVMHWGISNFYYIRGRGGVLVQLDQVDHTGEAESIVVSDESWKTCRFASQDDTSVRMSVQHPFAEIIDARAWDANWVDTNYEDSAWENARVIGPVGMEPWTELVPRNIPFLTEQPVAPSRVLSMRTVRPVKKTASLDMCVQFLPQSADDANPYHFLGLAATVIYSPRKMRAVLGFPLGVDLAGRHLILNGSKLNTDDVYGKVPEQYLKIELEEGDNLFLIDVSGPNRRQQWAFGVHSEECVEFRSPLGTVLGESDSSPFVSIGPFDWSETIDHLGHRDLQVDHPDYLQALQVTTVEELTALGDWLRPIPKNLAGDTNVLVQCIWKDELRTQPVPYQLQRLAIPSGDAAIVPVCEEGDLELIIDFGEQLSGFLSFAVEAEAGTVIDFYGYEHQDTHGIQHTYLLNNTLRYVCKEGYQKYQSPVRRGMRYLMITIRGNQKPVRFYRLEWLQSNYPIAEIGDFQCSDDRLNRIWDISRRTTKLCMEDTFVDCPAYEQTYWVGDSRNEALINYYLFGDTKIVERCLRLVPDSKCYTPLYTNQVPSGWNSVTPNWTFFWIIACAEYAEATNNLEFLQDILPSIRYTLRHYVNKINQSGLLDIESWNLLDWAPMDQPDKGVVTHQNMFLVKAFNKTAEMAAIIKDYETVQFATHQAERLKDAINEHLWSQDKQAYIDCIHSDGQRSTCFSMQTQVVAYLCRIPEGQRKETIAAYLTTPPEDFVQIGSPFMSFFYHEALAMDGHVQEILDDTRRTWGMMLDHGATTCWEMLPGNAINRPNPEFLTRSHTHAWSAAPGYFLGAYVLGVRPLTAGYEEVCIEPYPCDLAWAKGSIPLPERGRIDVRWIKEENARIALFIEAPEGVRVKAKFPAGVEGTIHIRQGNEFLEH